ncbi:MAG: 16S rRNA (uracil(1498)-N(3))-methyltransferase [Cyclobacteriaceae bacterium]|nr:16S rRNA (uracil(1498)-N(3))-methyltransferase [Cyclobacteriaceae bacterium]MBX2955122.1 16S rRNA (uracil(1498)-N(3))-methyltransferase [Cyclobacteriaceae bacterium]
MENLFYQPDLSQGALFLTPEESKHCLKVLRKKQGDTITLTDGAGYFYEALITEATISQCRFSIQRKWQEQLKKYHIHLAISPTKNPDRIEWMVEKCVEIGIDQITFLSCKNTERKSIKSDRMLKVALSAMKQSVRATLPVLSPLTSFQDFIKTDYSETAKFIAYVDMENPTHLMSLAKPGKHYLVLVGPEGDFTQQELNAALHKGFTKISLGNHRLRTETAGLAACLMLNLVNT